MKSPFLVAGVVGLAILKLLFLFFSLQASWISALTDFGLLICAGLALRQISLSKGQVAIQELKSFGKFLEDSEDLSEKYEKENYDPKLIIMKEYRFSEITTLDEESKKNLEDAYKFYKNNPKVNGDATFVMNQLEIISTVFNHNIGSFDVVKRVIALGFCRFVQKHAILYAIGRHDGYMLYENTIKLYQILITVFGTTEEQKARFQKEMGGLSPIDLS